MTKDKALHAWLSQFLTAYPTSNVPKDAAFPWMTYELKGERVLDVVADLIDPIANIAQDQTASALFKREKLPEGMTAKAFLLKRARTSLPALLKGHKSDFIAILATLEGNGVEEYTANLNLAKLMQDATELLTDEAFGELFISAQSGKSSGSAQENTEEAEA